MAEILSAEQVRELRERVRMARKDGWYEYGPEAREDVTAALDSHELLRAKLRKADARLAEIYERAGESAL